MLILQIQNKTGQTVQVAREIDFVATRGGKKTYIQSAYAMDTEEKAVTESKPLSLTGDAFPKIIVRQDIRKRWYDKYMSDLDNGTEEYCIISMDLNGLKEINDSSGHAAGDKYLLEFSGVLKQCFEDKGFIARIGGDEFIAVLKEPYFAEVDNILTRLKDALEVKNVLYPGYRRSVATGYAFSTEITQRSSHSVYLLADKRMYENKKLMHAKLGIAARI